MEEKDTKKIKKEKNLNESIISIRVKLQNAKLKKSGHNRFAGFDYFELADFLPKLNELMLEENINDVFVITDKEAKLTLVKGEECQPYSIPFTQFSTPLNKSGQPSMQDIQYLGALNTYYKRYLYLNAFGITDGEIIDSMDNNNLKPVDITDKIVKMDKLIMETDTDRDEFYTYFKVADNTEMSEKQIDEAIKILEMKAKK